jgi:prepilin-type N-terminal cleavage/methylation domain-containing protein
MKEDVMKSISRSLKLSAQAGFTLIELMIVVGIIGILVAIAAPNFARYQSKARQSEAKIALAAIYGGEKSFYSEYSVYIGSMDAIGYAPEGSKRFYSVGFSAAPNPSVGGFAGARTNHSISWVNNTFTCTNATAALGPPTGANDLGFDANADGCVRSGAANLDRWSINEVKNLRNYVNSL